MSKAKALIRSLDAVPAYAQAKAKLAEIRDRKAAVAAELKQISDSLQGLPKGREAITFAARRLLAGEMANASEAVAIAEKSRTLQQEFDVLAEAERLQTEALESEQREASIVVCESLAPEHREMTLRALELLDKLIATIAEESDFCYRLRTNGIHIGGAIVEEPLSLDRFRNLRENFVLGLEQAGYLPAPAKS